MPGSALENTSWRDLGVTAIYAVIVALLLRLFVVSAHKIPSHSMENTLLPGDYIVVSKLTYHWRDIHRGDVVVFERTDTTNAEDGEMFIKRVVGLPGDTLVFTEDGIIVNSLPLMTPPEAKIPSSPLLASMKVNESVIVNSDSVYVVGDNRRNSFDSRYWGCVGIDKIKGTPLFIYWSYGVDERYGLPHIRWDRFLNGIH